MMVSMILLCGKIVLACLRESSTILNSSLKMIEVFYRFLLFFFRERGIVCVGAPLCFEWSLLDIREGFYLGC